MIAKTGKYYILECANKALTEEEYIETRREAYEDSLCHLSDDIEPITFEEYLESPDYELKYILEVDTNKLKECETLDDIDNLLNQLNPEGFDKDMRYEDDSLAIKTKTYSYKLTENLRVGVEFDIQKVYSDLDCSTIKEIDYDNLGETDIKGKYIYFVYQEENLYNEPSYYESY